MFRENAVGASFFLSAYFPLLLHYDSPGAMATLALKKTSAFRKHWARHTAGCATLQKRAVYFYCFHIFVSNKGFLKSLDGFFENDGIFYCY